MNKILGYYTYEGNQVNDILISDYFQLELLGSHAKNINATALVSKNNLQLIIQFIWYLGKDGYPITYNNDDKTIKFGRGLKMHKLLFPKIQKGYVVDHINRNKLDNRFENLRICTQKENSYNSSKHSNSKQNYKGIKKMKNNTWIAKIITNGNTFVIKDILNEKDAALIYDLMAEELFGIYAGKNFQ